MTSFRKFKRNSYRILQTNIKSFVNIWMVEYNKVNAKLSDSQINKLNKKMFEGNNLPHDLLLTTRFLN